MQKIYASLIRAACVLLTLTTIAAAQNYPTRSVRVIVPFPPGGFNDIVARVVAAQLTERMGKQFIVDNRTGAGSVVGTEVAAHAPNDGHTLLIASLAMTITPWFNKLNYDPLKAFTPVAILAKAPNVLAVRPDLPVNSAADLIALAKKQPGKLQYASAGIGSFMHMGPELFKQMAGVDILHVPFRGAGPALIDVIGGNTHLAFAALPSGMTHFRSGKLKAIGVGSLQRNSYVPDIPTIAESGLPGYEFSNWIGIVAPTGTRPDIVAKLHKELTAIQDSAELKKQFAHEATDVVRMSSAEYGTFIADQMAKWGQVLKAAKPK